MGSIAFYSLQSISAEENPSNGELSEDADLKEAYNKLCKVAAKDAMNVEFGLKKIEFLEFDKKNLLVKLFDANELLNNVKTENMLLLDKVKSLELDLSVARSAISKLNQMLSVQKSLFDKSRLGYVESISVSAPYSTNFVPSSSYEPSMSEIVSETIKPPMSEVVKLIKVSPSRKIKVNLKESKPKRPTMSKDKIYDKPAWVCHFYGKSRHIHQNCYKLQAASYKESKQTKGTCALSTRSYGTH